MTEEDKKKGTWYRFFFPLDADWSPKQNLYAGRDRSQNFYNTTGGFPLHQHDYSDHTN